MVGFPFQPLQVLFFGRGLAQLKLFSRGEKGVLSFDVRVFFQHPGQVLVGGL